MMYAKEKLTYHYNMMKETKYNILPLIKPDLKSTSVLFNRKALSEAYLNKTEERTCIQGKFKPIHTNGISAPISFKPLLSQENKYTGLYKSGFNGIIRLSRATSMDSIPYIYGFALKAFIDSNPSVNFHAMYSLDGQENDDNFFLNTFSTTINSPKSTLLKIISFFFNKSIPFISNDPKERPVNEKTIPLVESASIECDGKHIENPIFPTKLLFIPKIKLEKETTDDFRIHILNQVKSPNELYDVYDDGKLLIGKIELIDDFIASSHGDYMHFEHQKKSEL